jgi:hypothetical protein
VIDESQPRARLATLIAVGVVPFLVLAAWHWRYGPLAAFGDWAQYMLHADALLHGRSYGDIGYIFTSRSPFIGPPVQPPGLPAVLVPLLAITDGAREGPQYKLLMLGFALAFLASVAAYFSRLDKRPLLAVAATLMTGLWLEVGFATNAVQPDVGFCAFVWGCFYLADRPGAWSWKRVAGITALGLAALAFRLAALPLVPALALFALLHRRTHGVRPWVPVIVWCVCGAAAVAAAPGALTFARLVPRDPGVLVSSIIAAAKLYPFFKEELDDYSAIMLEALGDRLAEAFAERLHQRVRTELWGHEAGEDLDNAALIAERYRGIRPAPGYPACPDHTEKRTLWELLDVTDSAGIELTDGMAMWPGAAVSGWYLAHPQSQYFVVGRLGRDQVADYAERKGWTLKETERWLSPNLGYDPED